MRANETGVLNVSLGPPQAAFEHRAAAVREANPAARYLARGGATGVACCTSGRRSAVSDCVERGQGQRGSGARRKAKRVDRDLCGGAGPPWPPRR